jgi:hypothetical protein
LHRSWEIPMPPLIAMSDQPDGARGMAAAFHQAMGQRRSGPSVPHRPPARIRADRAFVRKISDRILAVFSFSSGRLGTGDIGALRRLIMFHAAAGTPDRADSFVALITL